MIGPIAFHPEGCFDGGFLIVDGSGGAGGDEETPSIANISSETFFDNGTGGGVSGIDRRRAASERSLFDWLRTII